jgi:hypothetical protein
MNFENLDVMILSFEDFYLKISELQLTIAVIMPLEGQIPVMRRFLK